MVKRCICVIMSIFMLCSMTVHATNTDSIAVKPEQLFISTLSCPSDVLDYVSDNVDRFILSMDDFDATSSHKVFVGQPFTYGNYNTDLFLFPIYSGNKIIYTLRVAHDAEGVVHGTMSAYLADILNKYAGKTTSTTPLFFKIVDNRLYACLGDSEEHIMTFRQYSSDFALSKQASPTELEVKDISVEKDIPLSLSSSRALAAQTYISLSRTESQHGTNNYWCSAYVTAAILRTLVGGSVSASTIMSHYYGPNPSVTQTLSMDDATEYARVQGGLTATTLVNSALSDSSLKSQLDMGCPVYLCMDVRNDNNIHTGVHAVALRGYSTAGNTWSIWDPEAPGMVYSSFSMGGDYVNHNGVTERYSVSNVYSRTIYNYYAY